MSEPALEHPSSLSEALDPAPEKQNRDKLYASLGMAGAFLSSACCIVPLVLFMLGAGGAWVGNLTALAPYKPLFLTVTAIFLGLAYWRVFRPAPCAEGEYCARPSSKLFIKSVLVGATLLAVAAAAFPYLAPYLLEG